MNRTKIRRARALRRYGYVHAFVEGFYYIATMVLVLALGLVLVAIVLGIL